MDPSTSSSSSALMSGSTYEGHRTICIIYLSVQIGFVLARQLHLRILLVDWNTLRIDVLGRRQLSRKVGRAKGAWHDASAVSQARIDLADDGEEVDRHSAGLQGTAPVKTATRIAHRIQALSSILAHYMAFIPSALALWTITAPVVNMDPVMGPGAQELCQKRATVTMALWVVCVGLVLLSLALSFSNWRHRRTSAPRRRLVLIDLLLPLILWIASCALAGIFARSVSGFVVASGSAADVVSVSGAASLVGAPLEPTEVLSLCAFSFADPPAGGLSPSATFAILSALTFVQAVLISVRALAASLSAATSWGLAARMRTRRASTLRLLLLASTVLAALLAAALASLQRSAPQGAQDAPIVLMNLMTIPALVGVLARDPVRRMSIVCVLRDVLSSRNSDRHQQGANGGRSDGEMSGSGGGGDHHYVTMSPHTTVRRNLLLPTHSHETASAGSAVMPFPHAPYLEKDDAAESDSGATPPRHTPFSASSAVFLSGTTNTAAKAATATAMIKTPSSESRSGPSAFVHAAAAAARAAIPSRASTRNARTRAAERLIGERSETPVVIIGARDGRRSSPRAEADAHEEGDAEENTERDAKMAEGETENHGLRGFLSSWSMSRSKSHGSSDDNLNGSERQAASSTTSPGAHTVILPTPLRFDQAGVPAVPSRAGSTISSHRTQQQQPLVSPTTSPVHPRKRLWLDDAARYNQTQLELAGIDPEVHARNLRMRLRSSASESLLRTASGRAIPSAAASMSSESLPRHKSMKRGSHSSSTKKRIGSSSGTGLQLGGMREANVSIDDLHSALPASRADSFLSPERSSSVAQMRRGSAPPPSTSTELVSPRTAAPPPARRPSAASERAGSLKSTSPSRQSQANGAVSAAARRESVTQSQSKAAPRAVAPPGHHAEVSSSDEELARWASNAWVSTQTPGGTEYHEATHTPPALAPPPLATLITPTEPAAAAPPPSASTGAGLKSLVTLEMARVLNDSRRQSFGPSSGGSGSSPRSSLLFLRQQAPTSPRNSAFFQAARPGSPRNSGMASPASPNGGSVAGGRASPAGVGARYNPPKPSWTTEGVAKRLSTGYASPSMSANESGSLDSPDESSSRRDSPPNHSVPAFGASVVADLLLPTGTALAAVDDEDEITSDMAERYHPRETVEDKKHGPIDSANSQNHQRKNSSRPGSEASYASSGLAHLLRSSSLSYRLDDNGAVPPFGLFMSAVSGESEDGRPRSARGIP